ncbi:MAG TPA: hypothetical protein VFB06_13330 [Streptosporangiaceae bacterium]|nr:hypothetical protein [Streptosporangiaceae bacterium]
MNRARLVAARLLLGLLVVGLPPAVAPAWTIAVAGFGALAVVAAAPAERRRYAVSIAVGAAIVTCAFSHAGIPVLAAEGMLILAYVLVSSAVLAVRPLIAGVVATLIVAGALTVHPGASAWLSGAGLAAAVAAFAVAVPMGRR